MIPRVARTLFLQKNHPKSEQKREGCFSSTLGTLLDNCRLHLVDFLVHVAPKIDFGVHFACTKAYHRAEGGLHVNMSTSRELTANSLRTHCEPSGIPPAECASWLPGGRGEEQNSSARELVQFLVDNDYTVVNAETQNKIYPELNFDNCHYDIIAR